MIEFGLILIMGKWDVVYGIKEGNEGLFMQGCVEYVEDVYEVCEKFVIDDFIVNVGINNFLFQYYFVLKNGIVQVGNDYMFDNFVDEGVYILMFVLKWDIEYVVEEIECVVLEDNIVVVYLWFDFKMLWGSEQFELVFEVFVEYDFLFFLYGLFVYWLQYFYVGDEMLMWIEVFGFDWFVYMMVNIVNMIM